MKQNTIKILSVCLPVILIGFLLFANNAQAATYYISGIDGNDINCTGVAGTPYTSGNDQPCPWATISKINSSTFNPGDFIVFNKGETWREQLTVPSSGTLDNPITFGTYGSGVSPIISGADVISVFANGTSNIWDKTGITSKPNLVIMNNDLGTLVASRAAVTHVGDWYWAAATLSVYATSDPSGLVQAGNRYSAINLNYQSYIVIDNLHVTGSNGVQINDIPDHQSGAIHIPYDGVHSSSYITIQNITNELNSDFGLIAFGVDHLIIKDSVFGSVRGYGTTNGITTGDAISVWGYTYYDTGNIGISPSTNVTITGNTLNGTFGRQGISILNVKDGTISNNTILYCGAGIAVDIEPNPGYTADAISIENNTITPSCAGAGYGISTSPFYPTSIITNITINNNTVAMGDGGIVATGISTGFTGGNNIISGNTITGVGSAIGIKMISGSSTISRNTVTDASGSGIGILVFNGDISGLSIPTIATVSENIVSGLLTAIKTYGGWLTVSYSGNVLTSRSALTGIGIYNAGLTSSSSVSMSNNIVKNFQTSIEVQGSNSPLTTIYNNTIYKCTYGIYTTGTVSVLARNNIISSPLTSVIVFVQAPNVGNISGDYNMYYAPNSTGAFWQWGAAYPTTLSAWTAASGIDAHGIKANPFFTNVASENYSLQAGSPAIDSGLNLGSVYELGLDPLSTWPSSVIYDNQNAAGTSWERGAYVFPTAADISTFPATSVSAVSVILNAIINSTGGNAINQSGFTYSTDPTLTSGVSTTTLGSQIITGNFSQILSGLSASTTYYFRAYTVNSVGTSIGEILSTTTLNASIPVDTTPIVPAITTGVIFSSGGGSSASSQVRNLIAMGNYNLAQEIAQKYNITLPMKITTTCKLFETTLAVGMTRSGVKQLQVFLNSQGFTVSNKGAGSINHETNYFGLSTKKAPITFQEHYRDDVLKPNGLTKGTGFFGQASMKKVNKIIDLMCR